MISAIDCSFCTTTDVDALIATGANVNMANKNSGAIPLRLAEGNGYLTIVHALIAANKEKVIIKKHLNGLKNKQKHLDGEDGNKVRKEINP